MMKVYLILHNIRSVHNVGSIFRTAECAGVDKIFLTGYTPAPIDRFGRKRKDIAKVALGAEEIVKWEYKENINEIMKKLNSIKIFALEQSGGSIDYKEINKRIKKDFALIVGNEVGGIEKEILEMCDQVIEIPIKGKKESLNVSVATGIALFRLLNI
jgi:23S rRNA (guanosine2251-2'-O)-methyltransferase